MTSAPRKRTDIAPSGLRPPTVGGLPGTERSGLLLLEYVNVERSDGTDWVLIAPNVPVTIVPLSLHARCEMAAYTRKPLGTLWMAPSVALQDGDGIVRSDGIRWIVRGEPIASPLNTHIVALVESEEDDTMFAQTATA